MVDMICIPVGSWVNQCENLCKMLKPIMPDEAKSKEEMHMILRRRMLHAMMECPDEVAHEITYSGRLLNIMAIVEY